MDKRWKALTAPLWAELAEAKAELRLARSDALALAHVNELDTSTCTSLRISKVIADYGVTRQRGLMRRPMHELLKLRRARLSGECPVYWALVNK